MDKFFDILVLNDDVLGYKVTLQPELNNAQYVVKFTPIPASPRRTQAFPNQSTSRQEYLNRPRGRPTQIRRTSQDQVFRTYGQQARRYPIVETLLEAVAEAGRAEENAQVRGSSIDQVVGASQAASSATSRRTNQQRSSHASQRRRRDSQCERRTRRRRRRRARRPPGTRYTLTGESDESMYEVIDVAFEKITDLEKVEPPKDWRLIPKYKLTPKEIMRQEKELFFSMASEGKAETPDKPKDGEPVCCVCLENAATRVVVPCGHRCLCQPCAYNLATSRSTFAGNRLPKLCPICQAAISIMPRLC